MLTSQALKGIYFFFYYIFLYHALYKTQYIFKSFLLKGGVRNVNVNQNLSDKAGVIVYIYPIIGLYAFARSDLGRNAMQARAQESG